MTTSGYQSRLTVPDVLTVLLREADAYPGHINELDLAGKLAAAVLDPEGLTASERRGAFAEIEALRFQRPGTGERGNWGIYWGALTGYVADNGKEGLSPDALQADEDTIAHWMHRANTAIHPGMRARFADLSWEVGRLLKGRARGSGETAPCTWSLDIPHTLAQIAIDSSIRAVEGGFCDDEYDAWHLLDRAAGLAISINDRARLATAKASLFRYNRMLKDKDANYQWWRFDDSTWERGKALELTADEKTEVVETLEAALATHADRSNGDQFDPHKAMEAADRLARRWAKAEDQPKMKVALKTAALAFEDAAKGADALLASAWLEPLIPRYRNAGLAEDATRVEQAIRGRAQDAQAEMKRIEVPLEITKEQLDEWADKITGGSLGEALFRIAGACLLKEKGAQGSLKNMVKNAPLLSMLPSAIMGSGGFTVAKVGSVQDDLEGRTFQHAADLFSWHAPWLFHVLNRAKEKHGLNVDNLVSALMEASQFSVEREPLLREGLIAWFAEDSVKAVHVLVPQLEAALRDLLAALGASVMEYREDIGGFEAIGFGRIIHHDRFRALVPSDIRFHLRALYCDARSINLRNRLAHGLLHPGLLGMGVANWVVHSLILVGTLRVTPKAAGHKE